MNHPKYDTACVVAEVPAELGSERRFVLWRLAQRPGEAKPTKVPCDARGRAIDATDPAHWMTLAEAVAAQAQAGAGTGIGVVLGDGLCGVDLDGVRDPRTGALTAAARDIVATLASYAETSPSGTGLHVLVRGVLPDKVKHKAPLPGGGHIEAYDRDRFLTMTGGRLPEAPAEVREATGALAAVCRRYGLLPPPPTTPAPATDGVGQASAGGDDVDALLVARAVRSDTYFARLWAGDTSDYVSQSEADLALCVRLLELVSGDVRRADALFRRSGLFRDKWDERRGATTYGARTWARALQAYTERLREPVLRASRDGAGPARSFEDEPPLWQPTQLITDAEIAQARRGGWLDEYIAYCGRRTDAPVNFHEAAGLVTLSSVVGRRAVLRLGIGDVYPNLWALILAPSSIYRKSTAIDLARDLITAVDEDLLAPDDFTSQRFVAVLAEHDGQPLTLVRDEFSGFFEGLTRLDFQAGLRETLCLVFDGRPVRREKMKPRRRRDEDADDSDWRFVAREPFLSVLAGSTPSRFYDLARPGDVTSGFLARFAFELPPDSPHPTLPIRPLDDDTLRLRAQLLERLHALRRLPLHVTLTDAVTERLNRYVDDLHAEAREAPHAELVSIVAARMPHLAVRVAMLLACADCADCVDADGRGHATITLPHFYRALAIVERWRHAALRVLGDIAPSYFERQAVRVVELVRRRPGGIARRDVMRALRLNRRLMDDLQHTLVERGEIVVRTHATRGGQSLWFYPPVPAPPPSTTPPAGSSTLSTVSTLSQGGCTTPAQDVATRERGRGDTAPPAWRAHTRRDNVDTVDTVGRPVPVPPSTRASDAAHTRRDSVDTVDKVAAVAHDTRDNVDNVDKVDEVSPDAGQATKGVNGVDVVTGGMSHAGGGGGDDAARGAGEAWEEFEV